MCSPMAATGAALALGSTGASMYGQKQVADARNDAQMAELARQNRFQEGASKAFDSSLAEFEDPAGATQAKRNEREQEISSAVTGGAQENYNDGLPGSTPDVVKTEIARRMTEALDAGKQEARGIARLGAFGDWQGDAGRVMGENANDLGKYVSFASGSSNVLPLELQAANQEGQGAMLASDVLGVAGNAAGMYGATGGTYSDIFGGGGTAPASMAGGSGPLQRYGTVQRKTKGYRGGIGF